jgi:hypothetical protein
MDNDNLPAPKNASFGLTVKPSDRQLFGPLTLLHNGAFRNFDVIVLNSF